MELSVQTLVAMLLGYKRPLYLKNIGRLRVNHPQAIDILEEILPEGNAYFSDYFWGIAVYQCRGANHKAY